MKRRGASYNIELAKQYGISAAALFNQLEFWSDKGKRSDGWVYKKYEDLSDELGLSIKVLRKAFDKLREAGLVETKVMRVGTVPIQHFRIAQKGFSESAQRELSKESDQRAFSINTEDNHIGSKEPRAFGSKTSRYVDGIIKKFETGKKRKLNNLAGQRRAAAALLRMKEVEYKDIIDTLTWYFSQDQDDYTVQVADLIELHRKWNKLRDLMELKKPKPGSFQAEILRYKNASLN